MQIKNQIFHTCKCCFWLCRHQCQNPEQLWGCESQLRERHWPQWVSGSSGEPGNQEGLKMSHTSSQ